MRDRRGKNNTGSQRSGPFLPPRSPQFSTSPPSRLSLSRSLPPALTSLTPDRNIDCFLFAALTASAAQPCFAREQGATAKTHFQVLYPLVKRARGREEEEGGSREEGGGGIDGRGRGEPVRTRCVVRWLGRPEGVEDKKGESKREREKIARGEVLRLWFQLSRTTDMHAHTHAYNLHAHSTHAPLNVLRGLIKPSLNTWNNACRWCVCVCAVTQERRTVCVLESTLTPDQE